MSGVDEHMIIFPVQWNVKDIKGLLRRETERMKKGSTLFLQKKKKRFCWKGFSYIAQTRAEWSILEVSVSVMAGTKCQPI